MKYIWLIFIIGGIFYVRIDPDFVSHLFLLGSIIMFRIEILDDKLSKK